MDTRKIIGLVCCLILFLFMAMFFYLPYLHQQKTRSFYEEKRHQRNELEKEQPISSVANISSEPASPGKQMDKVKGELKPSKPSEVPLSAQLVRLKREKKFEELIVLCQKHLGQKADEKKTRLTIKYIGEAYYRLIIKKIKDNDYAGVEKCVEELNALKNRVSEADSKYYKKWLNKTTHLTSEYIKRSQASQIKDVMRSGDSDKVDNYYQQALKNPSLKFPKNEFIEFKMKLWKKSLEAGEKGQAEKHLRDAAEVACSVTHFSYSGYRDTAVEKTLAENLSVEALLRKGKAYLKSKDYVMSVAYLMAAKKMYIHGDVERKWKLNKKGKKIPVTIYHSGPDKKMLLKREPAVYEALLGLCKMSEAGELRWLPPDVDSNCVESLVDKVVRFAEKLESLDKSKIPLKKKYQLPIEAFDFRYEIISGRLKRLIDKKEYSSSIRLCNDRLKWEGSKYLSFREKYMGIDPWEDVPEKIKERISKKTKKKSSRRSELTRVTRSQEWIPDFPGKKSLFEYRALAQAREGIKHLKANQTRAFINFREVLRRDSGGLGANEVKTALLNAIEEAQKNKNFSFLYDLAGFYMAELNSEAETVKVKNKLAECLQATADYYKHKFPMGRIFMLSLLADLLNDTPRGKQIHENVMKLGFSVVKSLELNKPKKPVVILPSGLNGLSVLAVDNKTQYHMMVFYNGPERFFVRFNPYRRGCVVLKNGKYKVGVIVSSDKVKPYKQEVTCNNEYQRNLYTIFVGDRPQQISGSLQGDYRILRVPPGTRKFRLINKSIGLISESK